MKNGASIGVMKGGSHSEM